MKVLILGQFDNGDKENFQNIPTPLFASYDRKVDGRLNENVKLFGSLKHGKTRVISKVLPEYPIVVVVGLGPFEAGFNESEELDEKKDNIRRAIASAVESTRSLDIENLMEIHFDACGDAEQVAISAIVKDWAFDELKSESLRRRAVKYMLADQTNPVDVQAFQKGSQIASLQNVSRRLQEMPANIMTPTRFAEESVKLCEPLGVRVDVHDRAWAEEKKMFSFLSVDNGSSEPCRFVELKYFKAGEKRPVVFVGKGITFDTGGISLKPASQMDLMRGDMAGAATVLCTIASLAKINAQVNVIGLIPLAENMPGSKASRPGDVVYAMNGKSIQIDNTDAEGRLVLADALCYADTFDPEVVVDIATLTGACKMALGDVAGAVMTNSEKYWQLLRESGHETGDRVWRLPLFKDFSQLVRNPHLADLINTSKDNSVGAGTIAGGKFLQEFSKCNNFIHVDMANLRHSNSSYVLGKGMTGRPMRTMMRFIQKIFL